MTKDIKQINNRSQGPPSAPSPLRAFSLSRLRAFVPSRLRAFAPSCLRAFALSCLLPFSLFSQDWKADLLKAYEIFNQDPLEIEIEHRFYPSLTAAVAQEQQTVWMCKKGSNYHVKQYGIELISNDRYVVMINENARIIGISNKNSDVSASVHEENRRKWDVVLQSIANLSTSLGIDTLQAKDTYTSTYLGERNGTKSYRFDYQRGEIQQSTVYLSGKTGLLERISCIYREPKEVEPGQFRQVRIELVYKKLLAGKKISNEQFSTSGIFQVNARGEVVLNSKYSQFRLLNNMN